MAESAELTTGSPIWDLDLSASTVATLERCNISRIGDLLKRANDGTLTELARIGDRRKEEILNALQNAEFVISARGTTAESRFETLPNIAETYCHPEIRKGGLAEVGDDGWAYKVGGVVYTLTADDRGWLVNSTTGTGPPAEQQRVGDRRLAEREFFRTVAAGIVAHRPYVCQVPIGAAHLVIVHVDGCWHVAEASAESWACAFTDEKLAHRAWLTRGIELLKEIAGDCGYSS